MNDESTASHLFKNSTTTTIPESTHGSLFKKLLKTSDDTATANSDNNTPVVVVSHQTSHHLMTNEHKLLNDLLSKPIGVTSANIINNSAMFPATATPANPKLISSIYNNRSESEIVPPRKVSKYVC
jgi:hypothetical protein